SSGGEGADGCAEVRDEAEEGRVDLVVELAQRQHRRVVDRVRRVDLHAELHTGPLGHGRDATDGCGPRAELDAQGWEAEPDPGVDLGAEGLDGLVVGHVAVAAARGVDVRAEARRGEPVAVAERAEPGGERIRHGRVAADALEADDLDGRAYLERAGAL